MFFHGAQSSRPPRKIDFMAGSERMLKAHHKNGVFLKTLEHKKSVYDSNCTKRLSKIQQDIYEVYFNEYVPLKEQANRIQGYLPRISNTFKLTDNSTFSKPMKLPGRERNLLFPKINSSSIVSSSVATSDLYKRESNENVLDLLRKRGNLAKNEKDALPETRVLTYGTQPKTNGEMSKRTLNASSPCSMWPDSMSDTSVSPKIDEKRLHILKTAIALTSQPAKTLEMVKKPKRLRKSFFVALRRQSKVVWETDMLQRIGGPIKPDNLEEDREKRNNIDGDDPSFPIPVHLKWRPSLSKNKIFNDEDDDEDNDDMVFSFVDRVRASGASLESLLSDKSRLFTRNGVPVHDIDRDMHGSDSSQDVFSVISERSGSFYSYSSYTTGSDDSTSVYSSESDEDFSN